MNRIHFFRPEGPKYDSSRQPRSGGLRSAEAHETPIRKREALPIGFPCSGRIGVSPLLDSSAPLGPKKILTRLAKLEDEIAKGRKELEGLLG
jgi:hypothetical protein